PGEVPEAELKWRIGMPIGRDITPREPLRKDDFAYPKVASYLHVGPYEKVGEAYQKAGAYLERNGWKAAGPPVEFYLNNPEEVPPENLETEILIPVEKK
ncbi:MAG TPA: GyrI-like domain-containing protein, partial [Candidatus Aminicenantes bacterium]|nr:GyrI-like domain-containing protein [Candidatus Aminicenantes bacterium]